MLELMGNVSVENADKLPRVLHSFGNRMGYPGIGTTAYFLINEVAKYGCRVIAVSASYDRIPRTAWKKLSTLEPFGIRVPFRLLGAERGRRMHDRKAAKILRRYNREIDIVHCWPGSALETLKAARRHGITSILHRTNTHTEYAYEITAKEHEKLNVHMPRNYFYANNKERLEREESEYRMADKIAVPSEFVARTFLDRGFSPEKLVYIRYGYDPERFGPAFDEKNRRHKDHIFTITYMGRGEPRKGLHYALQAWMDSGLCNRGRFLIGGDIDYFPDYRRMLDKWLSHPSVELLGFVSDVAKVLRESDVLVLPSLEEGSAKVTYEARACGCVLAVSDCAGARCRHMEDGLVHPAGDVSLLQQHLLMLEKDNAFFSRLRKTSMSGASNLTWSHAGKILAEEYIKCLPTAVGPGRGEVL